MTPFEETVNLLPQTLRSGVLSLPGEIQNTAEELRLRAGRKLSIVAGGREYDCIDIRNVQMNDLYTVLERASQYSVHTILERMRNGFVTVRGGHRIGICGLAITEQGRGNGFRQLSSLNIRIAREMKGIATGIAPKLFENNFFQNALIVAPPGVGKTTLLRDLIRCISDGIGVPAMRIGVADERGELGALWDGEAQMDLGNRTDILEGVPKSDAILMLLRGMNPQIIAMDEITDATDVNAILQVVGCGVSLLATAHGNSIEEMKHRPIYRELLHRNVFRCAVMIQLSEKGLRTIRVGEIPWYES